MPLLTGRGCRPPMKGMRTPRRIQPRTYSLANRFHSDALFRTRLLMQLERPLQDVAQRITPSKRSCPGSWDSGLWGP
jgi:hypothetical protein